MLDGFKKFIMRGNVIDLAVGVIIGAAFKPIIDALTDRILLRFISAIVNFLIVAAALYFCIVMPMNRLAERRKSGQADPEEAPSDEVLLLTEIRDALTNAGQGRLRQ